MSRCTSRIGREYRSTKAMRARLRRMPGAHVLCLIQYRGQAPLFDGQVQMKPCQVAAGLGDFGNPSLLK